MTDQALSPDTTFRGARDAAGTEERLREIRLRAKRFRDGMLSAKPVRYYGSFGLIRVPYPTRYAFLNVSTVPTPFVHILNRLFVIQVETAHGLRTLLASPSDIVANGETPFFKRMVASMGPFEGLGKRFLGPRIATVEEVLSKIGILPEDVDYISYDHLHTQDVRKWLGTNGSPGYFPNAKLLVMRQEWESTQALLPPQRDWYCPGGIEGVDPQKVVLLDGDTKLGDSVALIHTPGHTEGNHSFVVHTPEGLLVTSENGVCADAYAPLSSTIPGLASYARKTGMEVILNGNTLEGGLDQYLSMIQEKEIAGPSQRNPAFPNMACSSEVTPYWAFPGIDPTLRFGDVEHGKPVGKGSAS